MLGQQLGHRAAPPGLRASGQGAVDLPQIVREVGLPADLQLQRRERPSTRVIVEPAVQSRLQPGLHRTGRCLVRVERPIFRSCRHSRALHIASRCMCMTTAISHVHDYSDLNRAPKSATDKPLDKPPSKRAAYASSASWPSPSCSSTTPSRSNSNRLPSGRPLPEISLVTRSGQPSAEAAPRSRARRSTVYPQRSSDRARRLSGQVLNRRWSAASVNAGRAEARCSKIRAGKCRAASTTPRP